MCLYTWAACFSIQRGNQEKIFSILRSSTKCHMYYLKGVTLRKAQELCQWKRLKKYLIEGNKMWFLTTGDAIIYLIRIIHWAYMSGLIPPFILLLTVWVLILDAIFYMLFCVSLNFICHPTTATWPESWAKS